MIRVRDEERETMMSMEEFEARARAGELSPLLYVNIPALTGDRFVQARELPLFVALYDPRRVHFKRHFSIDRLPIATGLLCLLCIGFFFLCQHLGDGVISREALLLLGAKAKSRLIEDGETWRLVAANLLHRDGVHLGFNLFALVLIGAVLEGVYRRGDLLLLFVVSGIATMAVSSVMGTAVTVGASGLVFGCLGAAVIFGWRYADVLPLRYRVYFGVVVVIYAAAMFYLGLRSQSTDNWGHAGGLVAGGAMAFVLTPRLLRLAEAREPARVTLKPYGISLALVVVCALIGPILPALLTDTEVYRLDAFGVRLERPAHWPRSIDEMGISTFSNGVDGFVKLGCARLEEKSTLEPAMRRFIDGELRRSARAGHIAKLNLDVPARAAVGAGSAALDAMRVPFSFIGADGRWDADAYLFSRGQLECALVLGQRPGSSDSLRERLDRVRSRLAIEETRAELKARERASGSESPRAWLSLALARQEAGSDEAAREAFDAAARMAIGRSPGLQAEVAFARARFELNFTGDLVFAEAHAAQAFATRPRDVETGVLLGDVLLARGDKEAAATLGERLTKLHGEDPRVVAATKRWGP